MNVSFGLVGFGCAIVAGLVLAIIGHPSPSGLLVAVEPVVATNPPKSFVLKSVTVDLPVSEAGFPGPPTPTRSRPIACPVTRRAW
jgi:hypothetical protein